MSTYKKLLKLSFRQLSKKLNIREDFILSIHEEKNSWHFISKLAQLVEGVFTKILVQRLNEPAIRDTVSNLSQATRIDLAYDLQIITKEQKLLFLTIAEIRNAYIHNIANIEIEISEYLAGLKHDRKKDIFKRFKPFLHIEKELELDSFIADSRNLIFIALSLEITRINGEVDGFEAERNHRDFRLGQGQKLLPKIKEGELYLSDRTKIYDHVESAKSILKEKGLL